MKVRYIVKNNVGVATDLTGGKVYDVLCDMGDEYLITDDNDDDYPYLKAAFEVMEEKADAWSKTGALETTSWRFKKRHL